MKKVVLALSGGLDSAVLLYQLLKQGYKVLPIWFDYGSKHNKYEGKAAYNILNAQLDSDNIIKPSAVPMAGVFQSFKSNLLKTGGEIPEGHYEEESMKSTVVPARNMIFISILTGIAISEGASQVALAVHAGDHHIYPDCRPAFMESMKESCYHASGEAVGLTAPFLHLNKTEIVKIGIDLDVPFRLTRTCYKDQRLACGKCGSCTERLEAFAANHRPDPIEYEGER